MKKLLLCTLTVFSTFTPRLFAQDQLDLLNSKTRDVLNKTLDGEIAKEYVVQIAQHHRVQASPGYRAAATYVLAQLKKYRFSDQDAYIESYPSDGKIEYQTWQSPAGWDVSDAEISIAEPTAEKLQSFKDVPMSLMTYSNPGDETAELAWVGAGTSEDDYRGKDVEGKFVLATGYGGDVHRLAVLKHRAKAVVCYLDDQRGKEHPDMVQYTGIWPRADELKKVTFGFNISYRQGERLKAMLQAGTKVVLHGWVKGTGLQSYFLDVVVARIAGVEKPDEELVFSAHLDHPQYSANDNASGSAAILDIARGLKAAIDSGMLPRPRRSFRFLWVPEWYGTMAYINAHPEMKGPDLGGKVLADMNLDMVGENTDLLHSKLFITRTPFSLASCLNDIVANMASMVDGMDVHTPNGSSSQFNYRVVPYEGGSDHMMFIDRKIPSVMLGHSDWTHHTSEDTPDKVDPTELKRCEMIAAGSLWYLANLTTPQAYDLIELIRSDAGLHLGEMGRRVPNMIDTASIQELPNAWARAENMMNNALSREITAANSVTTFNDDKPVADRADGVRPHLARRFEYVYGYARLATEASGYASEAPPAIDDPPDTLVPVRLTQGPLDFRLPESRLHATDAAWYTGKEFPLTGDERFELVNYIDGKHTVTEIHMNLIAEFGPIPLEAISHYMTDLVKVGVVAWRNNPKDTRPRK